MSDVTATNSQSGPQKPVSSDNTSPSVTGTIQGLTADIPELTQILGASKTSGIGFTRLFRTTSRHEVSEFAAKLLNGTTLTAEDLVKLKTIADSTTSKGSASAKTVLQVTLLKSIQTGALTQDDLTLLKSIQSEKLFTHGSAELIQKYGETLKEDKAEFANAFTKSQKTETGFTKKHDDVFKMAVKYGVKTGGDPGNFMRLDPLYIKLAKAKVSHYPDSADMTQLSKTLMSSLATKTKLSTAITDKTVTPEQGVEIATVVSEFFTTSIATLKLSSEYVADLKAFLDEVRTHFTQKEMPPKDIALTKFKQFTSNYMLRNFNPILAPTGKVGVYLSKITQNAANMVLFGDAKIEPNSPETLNPSVLTGIDSLLAMGVLNGLFTPEEVAVIGQEIAELKVKADGLKPQMPPSPVNG